MEIRDALDSPHLVDTVLGWHLAEWPKPGIDRPSIERRILGDRVRGHFPTTLIAVEQGTAVGFASLIFHPESAVKKRPYWIDAVFVASAFRRMGVTSLLIRAAEKKAASMRAAELHVLTEIPLLYAKNGWSVVERIAPADFILSKSVPGSLTTR